MIDKNQAREIALAEINRPKPFSHNVECGILDEFTREEEFGWVFFYDSKLHQEIGEARHALAGNAPIIVNRHDGSCHVTGTAHPIEHYIERYRKMEA